MIDPSRLQPMDDFMIVKLDKEPKKSTGGILLPAMTSKETKLAVSGIVEAIGPGHLPETGPRQPMDYEVGDVVVFNQWSGSKFELEVGGGMRIWLSQRNTFGRVNPDVHEIGIDLVSVDAGLAPDVAAVEAGRSL